MEVPGEKKSTLTLGKLLGLCKPQFVHLWSGVHNTKLKRVVIVGVKWDGAHKALWRVPTTG